MRFIVYSIFIAFSLIWSVNTNAQSVNQATQMLNQVKENMLSEESWFFDFELEIFFPELDPEVIKGKLYQDGNKIRADLGDQVLISDGETVWTYIRDFNEVQISNYEEGMEEMFLSPTSIVSIYESGEYAYQYSGAQEIDGRNLHLIEFKPSQPGPSEYVKINLFLDMDNKIPYAVGISARNGTRYNLVINDHDRGANHPAGTFSFDESEFPGVEIEDLRF